MTVFTPSNPGSLLFSTGTVAKLVNLNFPDENIDISCSGSNQVSESDVRQFKLDLDAQEEIASIPGYKKIEVGFITIGKSKNVSAVQHIYNMQRNMMGVIRQVILSHNNQGIIITFGTAQQRFENTNKVIFNILLDSLELF